MRGQRPVLFQSLRFQLRSLSSVVTWNLTSKVMKLLERFYDLICCKTIFRPKNFLD